MVVWLGESGVNGVHVSPEGTVLRRFSLISGDEVAGRPPALACNPALCLVGFSVFGDDGSHIRVSRVRSDGTFPVPRDTTLSPLGEEFRADEPSAAWDGRQFLVAWHDRRGGRHAGHLRGARAPGRHGLGPGRLPHLRRAGRAAAARGGVDGPALPRRLGRYAGRGGRHLRSARAPGRDGGRAGGLPRLHRAGGAARPAVAHIGGRSLVVWEDARGGGLEVRGARVKEDATVEDSGFLVSSGGFPFVDLPAVAAGADRYFVSFASRPNFPVRGGELLGTRVERDGDVKDRPPLILTRSADEQRSPAVAASDEGYLVAWRDFREPAGPALYAARVRPDGTVRDSRGLRLPAGPEASEAAVASDGRDFLVVWSEPVAGAPPSGVRG